MSTAPDGGIAQSANALRIIQLAMAGGIVLLAVVVGFLYETHAGDIPTEGQLSTLKTISVMALFYAAAAPVAGTIVGRNILGSAPTVQTIQSARLIRLALGEGAAMLGLVACMLGALHGVLRANPVYWLDAAPAAVFVLWALKTLPDEEFIRSQLSRA